MFMIAVYILVVKESLEFIAFVLDPQDIWNSVSTFDKAAVALTTIICTVMGAFELSGHLIKSVRRLFSNERAAKNPEEDEFVRTIRHFHDYLHEHDEDM